MLTLTIALVSVTGSIGQPQGVRLLDDAPLLAQVAPPLVPADQPPSDATVSAQQLEVDLVALKKARPGLGGAITLLAVGGGVAIVGGIYAGLSAAIGSFTGGLNIILIVGVVGLAIGLPLAAIGAWMLYNRLEDRKRIDDQSKQLKLQLQQLQRPANPAWPQPPPSPAQVQGPRPTLLLAAF